MSKIIKKIISACSDCPYCEFVEAEYSFGSFDRYICFNKNIKTSEGRSTVITSERESNFNIPSWCPLEDVC